MSETPETPNIESLLPKAGERSVIPSEAVALAFFTGVLYLVAGAYQFGYQDQFGFTYISLGAEDLVIALRAFLIPLMIAISASIVLGFGLVATFKRLATLNLLDLVALSVPIPFIAAIYFFFGRGDNIRTAQTSTYVLPVVYYAFDPLLLAFVARRLRLESFAVPSKGTLRAAQSLVGGLFLCVVAYDIGTIDALNITDPLECPDINGRSSIEVQQTGDLTICVEVDLQKRLAYERLYYFKFPDDGKPQTFLPIHFHPDAIGVAPPL